MINQRYQRHNIFWDETAFSNDNAAKSLKSCTEKSGTIVPVKQYSTASLHTRICLMGITPEEQGCCLKDSQWTQRKACEFTPKCQSAMQEDKSNQDVLSRIMPKGHYSVVLAGHCTVQYTS